MGSELARRGVNCALPLWSARALIEAPDVVRDIHRENVAAGARLLTAATFRTQRFVLRGAGLAGRARELTRLAVALARQAAESSGEEIFVAGSVAPLADCYRPDLVPEDEILRREHADHVQNLADAGVDLFLVETMNSIREAAVAAELAVATKKAVVVSLVTEGHGKLLSGEPLEEAAAAVMPLGLAAIGINCVSSNVIGEEVKRLVRVAGGLPVAVYANTLSGGDRPDEYARRARQWFADGALLIGGCCGTTPAHMGALARAMGFGHHGAEG